MPHPHANCPSRQARDIRRHLAHYLGAALLIVLVAWSTAPGREALSGMVH